MGKIPKSDKTSKRDGFVNFADSKTNSGLFSKSPIKAFEKAYVNVFDDYGAFVNNFDFRTDRKDMTVDVTNHVESAGHGFFGKLTGLVAKARAYMTDKQISTAMGRDTYDKTVDYADRFKPKKDKAKLDDFDYSAPMTVEMAAMMKLKFSERAYNDMLSLDSNKHYMTDDIRTNLAKAHAVVDYLAVRQGLDTNLIDKTAAAMVNNRAKENPGIACVYEGFNDYNSIDGSKFSLMPRVPDKQPVNAVVRFEQYVSNQMALATMAGSDALKYLSEHPSANSHKVIDYAGDVSANNIMNLYKGLDSAIDTLRTGNVHSKDMGEALPYYLSSMQMLESITPSAKTEGNESIYDLFAENNGKSLAKSIFNRCLSAQMRANPVMMNKLTTVPSDSKYLPHVADVAETMSNQMTSNMAEFLHLSADSHRANMLSISDINKKLKESQFIVNREHAVVKEAGSQVDAAVKRVGYEATRGSIDLEKIRSQGPTMDMADFVTKSLTPEYIQETSEGKFVKDIVDTFDVVDTAHFGDTTGLGAEAVEISRIGPVEYVKSLDSERVAHLYKDMTMSFESVADSVVDMQQANAEYMSGQINIDMRNTTVGKARAQTAFDIFMMGNNSLYEAMRQADTPEARQEIADIIDSKIGGNNGGADRDRFIDTDDQGGAGLPPSDTGKNLDYDFVSKAAEIEAGSEPGIESGIDMDM